MNKEERIELAEMLVHVAKSLQKEINDNEGDNIDEKQLEPCDECQSENDDDHICDSKIKELLKLSFDEYAIVRMSGALSFVFNAIETKILNLDEKQIKLITFIAGEIKKDVAEKYKKVKQKRGALK